MVFTQAYVATQLLQATLHHSLRVDVYQKLQL